RTRGSEQVTVVSSAGRAALGHAHTLLFVAGGASACGRPKPHRALVRITSVILTNFFRPRRALAGLLSGAIRVCPGFLVAGLTGPVGSPVVAVAELSIDLSPPSVKNFAIKEFGSHDKIVLQIGVLVVLAIFAAVIGSLAQRNLAHGMIGIGIFG